MQEIMFLSFLLSTFGIFVVRKLISLSTDILLYFLIFWEKKGNDRK